MKKMKKMKFVTKGLALVLMGVVLAGCSDKATVEETPESKVESVESQASSEESQVAVVESKEAQTTESSEEKQSSEAVVSSEATTTIEQSTEESKTPASQQVVTGDQANLVEEYKEYFKNLEFDGKQIAVDMNMAEIGIDSTFAMRFGAQGGITYIYMGMPAADSNAENGMSIYINKDSSAYLKIATSGMAPVLYKADHISAEDASGINFAGELVEMEEGSYDLITYDHEEVVGGVTYDVLKVETEENMAYFYMNKQTKEWEMMKMNADGQDVTAYITDLKLGDFESEFKNATKIGEEEFSQMMLMGMMQVIMGTGAMGLE